MGSSCPLVAHKERPQRQSLRNPSVPSVSWVLAVRLPGLTDAPRQASFHYNRDRSASRECARRKHAQYHSRIGANNNRMNYP